jgi:nucleoside-diphosphate-sugar epimerase
MRVLVTGVSGFSGAYIAKMLAAVGHQVVGVHRRDSPFLARAAHPEVTLLRSDLLDSTDFPGPFEAVIHTAATSPVPEVDTERLIRDNVDGTAALIRAAVAWRCRAFVFFSSLSLYGVTEGPVIDEDTPIINPNAYGATKHLAERMLVDYADRMPVLALRLPGVIGPGSRRNWLSNVGEKLIARQPITAFHLQAPFNNAAHVHDIGTFIVSALEREWTGHDAIVMGARGIMPVRKVIERLAEAVGVRPIIQEVTPQKASFILSSERAVARWGYHPMEIGAMMDRYGADLRAVDPTGAPRRDPGR